MISLSTNLSKCNKAQLETLDKYAEMKITQAMEGLSAVGELLQVVDLDSVTDEAKSGVGSLMLIISSLLSDTYKSKVEIQEHLYKLS